MSYNPLGGTKITGQEAAALTDKYNDLIPKLTQVGLVHSDGISFSKAILEDFLHGTDVEGIHFYYGVNADNRLTLLFRKAIANIERPKPPKHKRSKELLESGNAPAGVMEAMAHQDSLGGSDDYANVGNLHP